MKVILSVDPVKFPLTGIGRYTYELARGMQQTNLESLQFLRGGKLSSDLPHLNSNNSKLIGTVHSWKKLVPNIRFAVDGFRYLTSWRKNLALKGMQDHIFHGPNYYLPLHSGPSVVTFHDLSVYLWPQCHPPDRVRILRTEIEHSLSRTSALITDTEYTRREVSGFFGLPLKNIYAVPLASSKDFCPRSKEELCEKLSKYDLKPGEYTLYTGTIEPRKNLTALLDAYIQLPKAIRKQIPLVIAGYAGWNSEKIHSRINTAVDQGWLKYLGFVQSDLLPILMSGARLFVYPSLYEGFGLPVIEAMASGVPVICSNTSTLPEVAGEAAAFHDPSDVDTLLELLQIGMEDETWRFSARAAGLLQAEKFSWQKCVDETLKVYESVLTG